MSQPLLCPTFHTDTQTERDANNIWKDHATNDFLKNTPLDPSSRIIGMPGKWGPELRFAREQGVLRERFHPIEHVGEIREFLKRQGYAVLPPDRSELLEAIPYLNEEIIHDGFDEIYLDLQCLLTPKYADLIGYIVGTHKRESMIKAGGTLIVTTGPSQKINREALEFNRRALERHPEWPSYLPPTRPIIEDMLREHGRSYKNADHRSYKNSIHVHYLVTVIRF